MNFNEYKNLPDESKVLATSFWACNFWYRTGVKHTSELPSVFFKHLAKIEILKKINSRYWYKKINGQPLRYERDIKLASEVVKNSEQVLYHPLWLLLSKTNWTQEELLDIARNMPIWIQKMLLSTKTCGVSKTLTPEKYLLLEPLDALLCTLIHYLSNPSNYSLIWMYSNTTSLLLSLLSSSYKQSKGVYLLYVSIWRFFATKQNLFSKYRIITETSEVYVNLHMELFNNVIENEEEFNLYSRAYEEFCEFVFEYLEFIQSIEEARKFMLLVSNGQLINLKVDILEFESSGIVKQRSSFERAKEIYEKHYPYIKQNLR